MQRLAGKSLMTEVSMPYTAIGGASTTVNRCSSALTTIPTEVDFETIANCS
jgi:hypothetical protein